jgi:hypothetical protein
MDHKSSYLCSCVFKEIAVGVNADDIAAEGVGVGSAVVRMGAREEIVVGLEDFSRR